MSGMKANIFTYSSLVYTNDTFVMSLCSNNNLKASKGAHVAANGVVNYVTLSNSAVGMIW